MRISDEEIINREISGNDVEIKRAINIIYQGYLVRHFSVAMIHTLSLIIITVQFHAQPSHEHQ